MSKPGRNDPCSCGSGKKYKKCCINKEAAAVAERRRLHHEQQALSEAERAEIAARYRDPAAPMPLWILDDDPLDDISNSVLDLIRDENFDEALRVCQLLLADYPDVIDGLERSGLVYAAMGEHDTAADYYQRCLDFIDQHPDGFDAAAVQDYEQQLARMKRLAQAR